MKTLRFYKILIGILVVVNLTTVYFLWSSANGDHHPPHPKRNDLVDRLGITGDKKEQIMRLQDDHFKKKDALIHKSRELHEKLFLSFNDTSKDSTEIAQIIDDIVENQRETEQMTFDHFKDVSALCTTEEKKLLEEIIHDVLRRGPPPPRRK